ncbi:hypothetical protein QFZ30_003059 [Arthrobacter pascens]|uniref:hypothetical protein n=1 Tax=Arthrobacter pascens TaxID=1677 RepID=UPI002790AA28|nr:hypothetical protein [Arthrobacter pascens]MDQ0679677.1 hypothetical protein [Arthrobacter pascens]
MTYLEKIGKLRLNAVAADDENKIKSRSGEFTALRELLQRTTANAASVTAGREELQTAGYTQDGYDQDRALALSVVKDLINTIESLPIETKFDLIKIHGNSVEAHFKNSEKFVTSTWKAYVSSPTSADHDDLLNALEHGGIDVEAIRSDIDNAESALLTLKYRVLPQAGDVAKMRQALDTLNSIGARIGELIDPAIADLVVRAQDGGVPYSEMTSEVIVALEKLGILDRFRVVLT